MLKEFYTLANGGTSILFLGTFVLSVLLSKIALYKTGGQFSWRQATGQLTNMILVFVMRGVINGIGYGTFAEIMTLGIVADQLMSIKDNLKKLDLPTEKIEWLLKGLKKNENH